MAKEINSAQGKGQKRKMVDSDEESDKWEQKKKFRFDDNLWRNIFSVESWINFKI